nr:hypothetical protein [Micromonospora sp. DSM 115978]
VVVVVSSFLPWYGWRAGDSYHLQYTAWDNLLPLIAVVLVAVASVLATTRMFDGVRLRAIGPIGPSFLLVLLPAAAVVLMVVGWLTVGEATDPLLRSVLQGEARYGLFVGLGAALVQLVFAALAFQASGEGFAGRGRVSAPQPVPYGQPYGQQPTPGYWPHDQYAHAQAAPGQSAAYGYPQPPYPQAGAAPLPSQVFAPIDGP